MMAPTMLSYVSIPQGPSLEGVAGDTLHRKEWVHKPYGHKALQTGLRAGSDQTGTRLHPGSQRCCEIALPVVHLTDTFPKHPLQRRCWPNLLGSYLPSCQTLLPAQPAPQSGGGPPSLDTPPLPETPPGSTAPPSLLERA